MQSSGGDQGARDGEVLYSISEAARLAGVTTAVVRLWEREGLLRTRRTSGGHRLFTGADLERLRQIAFLRRVERLNAAAIRRELEPVPARAAEPPLELGPALGRRLRTFRLARKLSLAGLASRAGVSISFLSAVERGQSGISLGNLSKLADALGTTVPALRGQAGRPPSRVVRPEDRPRYHANQRRVLIEDLITQPGALEAQRLEILPGGESQDVSAHPGEEFVHVIDGQLTFWIGTSEEYQLTAGDSLLFPSTELQRWRNTGDRPAVILWVNVPLVEGGGEGAGRSQVARPRPPGRLGGRSATRPSDSAVRHAGWLPADHPGASIEGHQATAPINAGSAPRPRRAQPR